MAWLSSNVTTCTLRYNWVYCAISLVLILQQCWLAFSANQSNWLKGFCVISDISGYGIPARYWFLGFG